ncbi:MAG TPA: hypothetical protein VG370_28860 [Chloroflexota bacterium]|nr:hypothetical protein [Chloroflexota bacterium]
MAEPRPGCQRGTTLNPPEWVFQELRAAVEGRVYADLDAKVAAAEAALQLLAADPDRVRQLTGWAWIRDALAHLPAEPIAAVHVGSSAGRWVCLAWVIGLYRKP